VFLLLKSRTALGSTKLNFWRTKEKAEVDFVLVSGKTVVPVEVKYKSLKREEISRSLRSFIQKYKPAEAYIINLNLKKTIKIGETSLSFLPFYELLLKKF
jgi:predicted AAA+ superfamily ATPase